MSMRMRWGDAEDDEDVLPENSTVGPNDKGIMTKTEYFHNTKGEPMKKVTRIQLVKVQTRVYEVGLLQVCKHQAPLMPHRAARGLPIQALCP